MNNLMVLDELAAEHVEHEARRARAMQSHQQHPLEATTVAAAAAAADASAADPACAASPACDAAAAAAAADDDDPGRGPPHADAEACIAHVRACVMRGDLRDALESAEALAPGALHDPSFQLDLKLHHLDELVHAACHRQPRHRAGASGADEHHDSDRARPANEDCAEALHYARTVLAPYAQEAFPEAYNRFLEHMLIFVFPDRVRYMDERRARLADVIVSTLRARVAPGDSRLSLLVRYLLAVQLHAGAGFVAALVSPTATEALERLTGQATAEAVCSPPLAPWPVDSRPLPHGSTSRDFREVDIIALRERLPISIEEAVETLRYTGGDAEAALRYELGRMRLNRTYLEDLAREYCVARGLLTPTARFSEVTRKTQSSALRQLRQLTAAGSAKQLVLYATSLEPSLLVSSPDLHFRVAQATLVEELRSRKYADALRIAREELGPLAAEHPHLFPALRETTVLLAFADALEYDDEEPAEAEDGSSRVSNLEWSVTDKSRIHAIRKSILAKSSANALAGPIYKAVGRLEGESVLLELLKTMMETYASWVTASRIPDRFARLLAITDLATSEELDVALGSNSHWVSTVSNHAGLTDPELFAEEDEARSQKIHTLMEFLSVSRAEAITILSRHPPSVNSQEIIDAEYGS